MIGSYKRWILASISLSILAAVSGLEASHEGEEPFNPPVFATAWSPDGSRIAFRSSTEPGNWDIYTINVDGTNLTRITDDPGDDHWPAWRPDGQKLAFTSKRSGVYQVYVVNPDGTGLKQLTSNPLGSACPAWSPNGQTIAIARWRTDPSHNWDIVLIDNDGQWLSWFAATAEDEAHPVWSPNGQWIAYLAKDGLYKRNIDKTPAVLLAPNGPNGEWTLGQHSCSPDGNRIVYSAVEVAAAGGGCVVTGIRIHVVNQDGTSNRPFFQNEPAGKSSDPSWSPTGDKIAFVGDDPSGTGDALFTVNTDGTGLTQVTHTVAQPSFDPDEGTYDTEQSVSITCSTQGATIRYTTDGTEPTESSTQYTAPITVDESKTLRAKAWKTNYFPSAVKSAEYTMQAAEPEFDPDGGTYSSAQNVTMSCTTPDVTIRYTTDGTEPTGSSTQYTSPVAVSTNTTLKAKAFKTGWTTSDTKSADYVIQ